MGAVAKARAFFQVLSYYESHESRIQGELVDIEHDPMQTRLRAYHPDVMEIRKNYAKYHDAIKRMDQQVGDALAALEASGMADHTIVIYTSDHGGVLPAVSAIYITPDYIVH